MTAAQRAVAKHACAQVTPQLLSWTIHNNHDIYMCLKLPVSDEGLRHFPVAGRKAHITLSYKLHIELPSNGVEVRQCFWRMKHRLQQKLFERDCSMLLESNKGHTFGIHPASELHTLCCDLRSVWELDPNIRELDDPVSPFHIAWVDI